MIYMTKETAMCQIKPLTPEQVQQSMKLVFDVMFEQIKRLFEEQTIVCEPPLEAPAASE